MKVIVWGYPMMKQHSIALATEDILAELEDYEILKKIAVELTKSVKAAMRKTIKRLLRKYKYPPKWQEKALDTVLRQAKLMCEEMVA